MDPEGMSNVSNLMKAARTDMSGSPSTEVLQQAVLEASALRFMEDVDKKRRREALRGETTDVDVDKGEAANTSTPTKKRKIEKSKTAGEPTGEPEGFEILRRFKLLRKSN